ncbi:MAG: SdpI family protein [Candidatus Diapherotrites archaeon]
MVSNLKLAEVLMVVLIVVSFALAFYAYPLLPEQVVSHWGASGEPNGFSSREFGAFFLPVLLLGMLALFLVIPRIDPKRENIAQFRNYYNNFILAIMFFMFYIYALTLVWNINSSFDLVRWMVPGFAGLFFYAGVLIGKAKPNYSIGIRTPWTLASDSVWNKTHELGGKLFKAVAVISLLGMVFGGEIAFYIFLGPLLAAVAFLFIYSYVEFEKERKSKKRK